MRQWVCIGIVCIVFNIGFAHSIKTPKEKFSAPAILPCEGRVSSTFGFRYDPFTQKRKYHTGIDISYWTNSKIIATGSGIVTFSGIDGGYGLTLEIEHKNGIKTKYAHLNEIFVSKGDIVEKGKIIADMGSSGRATGQHLHYEVRVDNIPQNPFSFINVGEKQVRK
jgi:murein DD-endopeptidase MepM/ murein hydrolase activator NlpD